MWPGVLGMLVVAPRRDPAPLRGPWQDAWLSVCELRAGAPAHQLPLASPAETEARLLGGGAGAGVADGAGPFFAALTGSAAGPARRADVFALLQSVRAGDGAPAARSLAEPVVLRRDALFLRLLDVHAVFLASRVLLLSVGEAHVIHGAGRKLAVGSGRSAAPLLRSSLLGTPAPLPPGNADGELFATSLAAVVDAVRDTLDARRRRLVSEARNFRRFVEDASGGVESVQTAASEEFRMRTEIVHAVDDIVDVEHALARLDDFVSAAAAAVDSSGAGGNRSCVLLDEAQLWMSVARVELTESRAALADDMSLIRTALAVRRNTLNKFRLVLLIGQACTLLLTLNEYFHINGGQQWVQPLVPVWGPGPNATVLTFVNSAFVQDTRNFWGIAAFFFLAAVALFVVTSRYVLSIPM